MPEENYIADIYISYAGNDANDEYEGSRDFIVQNLCEQLQANNLNARQYKRDVGYKDSIGDFMDDIASADYIILLISDKYLRSEYCMYEATELLTKNRKNLLTKVFPVMLPDAPVRDNIKRVEYIKYWIEKYAEHKKLVEGLPPELIRGLTDISIRYREISENIDDLIHKLLDVAQLSKSLIAASDYTQVIDSILKQVAANQKGNLANPMAIRQSYDTMAPAVYNQLSDGGNTDVAAISKGMNDFLSNVINKFDDKIFDSEKAKKEYLDVNFDDISADENMSPLSRDLVGKLRYDTEKYESYRRSLIISALSLGLIKKYDEEKTRMLIDFVRDGEPGLWHRALVGLIVGLLDKEDYISDDIERKLKKLQQDDEVQECLVMIFYYLGNKPELENVSTSLKRIDYDKFEFFKRKQHWFMPFYENNPVLKENIPNKKFASELVKSVVMFGLDNTKYAVSLLYPSLDDKALATLESSFDVDRQMVDSLQTEDSKRSFLIQMEVLKFLLEFYFYAKYNDETAITELIEDKKMLRKGNIYQLTTNPHYKARLEANELLQQAKYEEAVEVLKPVLEEDPGNKQVLFMSGLSNVLAGKHKEAIPLFEKAREKGFNEALLVAHLGDCYFNTQQYEKAIENYELLLTMQQNIPAILNIGRGYQLKENPDHQKALEYFKKVEELDPSNYINLLSLGDYYYNVEPKDITKSYEYYYKAFEVQPDNLGLVQALDELALDQNNHDGDVERKVNIYKKYTELDPKNIRPYLLLGASLQDLKEPDQQASFEAYQKAYDLEPGNMLTNQYLGEIYTKIKNPDYEKALELLKVSLAQQPENKEANFYAGWSAFVLGKHEEAKQYLQHCLDYEYANLAYQNLGHIAYIENDEAKAKEYYKKGLELSADKDDYYKITLEDYQYLEKEGIDEQKFTAFITDIVKGE